MYKFLKIEKENRIAIVTVNKPEVLNTLDTPTVLEIEHCFNGLDSDVEVDVIIITGAGDKAFIAGGDIKEMSVKNTVDGREYGRNGQRCCFAIENCSKPVIAAVNGYALGGGTELAMACDIILASEKAVFGQPEVKLGITPGFAGTQRLPRIVGRGMGKELVFSGRNIRAEEALRIGLTNMVIPHENLMGEAVKLASQISTNGQNAVRSCKELITFAMDTDQNSGLAKEADAFGCCFSTEEQKEGMAAFLDKRAARFKGK
ncbi:MAG: enoyl-CoA hydratase-related protein [Thermoplasmata archaeon]|nr:enoyl-CoA hydratase-related protein [Thermoplasmata archaeon]